MIDFSRTQLTHTIVHYVGNKGIGEAITIAEKCTVFTSDFEKETLLRYFLAPFRNDIYYQFKPRADVSLISVAASSKEIFATRKGFEEISGQLANLLYNQTMHPKINGGEFYMCFFKDVLCDGELVDCIGIFKTERKETFLKVLEDNNAFTIECDSGIDISKLDKGCLIFNTDAKNGYKLSIIDANNKVAECALYWEEDFLNAEIKANNYYHTKNFIDTSIAFCEEVLTEANNVPKEAAEATLRKSVSFFNEREKFNLQEFEKEVLTEPEVIKEFEDYREGYNKRMGIKVAAEDDFDISFTAVKKNKKYMRTIKKLDHNFHLYIHGKTEYLEKGFDEAKGLKYYKVFYVNEE